MSTSSSFEMSFEEDVKTSGKIWEGFNAGVNVMIYPIYPFKFHYSNFILTGTNNPNKSDNCHHTISNEIIFISTGLKACFSFVLNVYWNCI